MRPPRLSPDEITARLASIPAWSLDGAAIRRQFVFRDFREAVAFLVLIAFDAEQLDHHPDVTLNYKRLTLSLSTHSEGGLTQLDFGLARLIDDRFAAGKHAPA